MIHVVTYNNDIVTAFFSLKKANSFIQGTNYIIRSVKIEDYGII